jgi:acid phosphatase
MSNWVAEALEPRCHLSAAPHYDHIVVVFEENRSYTDVYGGTDPSVDPYLHALGRSGAKMTDAHALQPGSLPNYLFFFAGKSFGLDNDEVPDSPLPAPDLGGQLLKSGLSFKCFADGLPKVGYTGVQSGDYVRRHNPAIDFADVPASLNRPFSEFPQSPRHYASLPTVSLVIPDVKHNMEDGTVSEGDAWLEGHLSSYAAWARKHNSLLIVTWDEGSINQHIPTVIYGANIHPGAYTERINLVTLLRTIENTYDLPIANAADRVNPLLDIFI